MHVPSAILDFNFRMVTARAVLNHVLNVLTVSVLTVKPGRSSTLKGGVCRTVELETLLI
jgi:hypothetical protein